MQPPLHAEVAGIHRGNDPGSADHLSEPRGRPLPPFLKIAEVGGRDMRPDQQRPTVTMGRCRDRDPPVIERGQNPGPHRMV